MPYLSSLSLALNRPGAVGGAAPLTLEQQVAALFSGGEQGAWYDPSDFSTMHQAWGGTAPVTAVEQPVGLILDKRKGLALETALDTSFTNGWSAVAGGTVTDGDTFTCASVGGITKSLLTVGKVYKLTFSYIKTGLVTQFSINNESGATTRKLYEASAASGSGTIYFYAQDTNLYFRCSAADTIDVTWSIQAIQGNHAYQTSSAARPVLRARYNLLTYSEQFNQASQWALSGSGFACSISANTGDTNAPDGTATADKMTEGAGTVTHGMLDNTVSVQLARYTASVYAKAGTATVIQLGYRGTELGANAYANFDLSTGQKGTVGADVTADISAVAGATGWYRCTITSVANATATRTGCTFICLVNSTTAARFPSYASTGAYAYVWGADLRVGTSAGTYQRIAAATDYATGAAFPVYLEQPTGGDDSLITANSSFNDFAASDAPFYMAAGVTRYGTTRGTVFCLADNTNATAGNNDTVNLECDSTAQVRGYLLDYDAGGNTEVPATAGTLAAEQTFVASWQRTDTDGFARRNGTAGTGADQTAPALTLPLATVMAQRRGTTPTIDQRFTGRLFGLVVRAGAISAGQMSAVENYLAGKAGITL